MSKVIDWVSDLIFPNRCAFCGEFIAWEKFACEKCARALEYADFCPKCGKSECECAEREFHYDGCAVVLPYVGITRDGVLTLKYHNGFNTAKYLTHDLAAKLNECGYLDEADIITAVPMTKSRRRQTGYNQSEYIAKCLSKHVNIPCDFKLIKKVQTGFAQHDLTAEERRMAVVGAYSESPKHADISGKTIILCDDIITTGSTLSECAKVLKSMRAKKVYCAVLTGTIHQNADNKE